MMCRSSLRVAACVCLGGTDTRRVRVALHAFRCDHSECSELEVGNHHAMSVQQTLLPMIIMHGRMLSLSSGRIIKREQVC